VRLENWFCYVWDKLFEEFYILQLKYIWCWYLIFYILVYININCRSQWPRGLRRRSTAARLQRSWVRISPGAWMFVVSVVCYQVEVSATD
jgi:hypothetical protein